MKTKPLFGIFDSGVGGFSVLQEIRKVTDVDILYFGDCARAPYGNRAQGEIVSFIREILLYLQSQGVTHFVSACNSMSVVTTEKLLKECGIPRENYIDMIDAVKIITFPSHAKILIIATKATIDSGVYQHILSQHNPIETYTPKTLAGEIEKGDKEASIQSIDAVLLYAEKVKATHILYACTHYPLVDTLFKERSIVRNWVGEYIDPSVYVAQLVCRLDLPGSRILKLTTSKETDAFKKYSEMMW